jgi:hypothetical protein
MQKVSPALVELVKLIARELARADLAAQRVQADTARNRLDRPCTPASRRKTVLAEATRKTDSSPRKRNRAAEDTRANLVDST